MDSTLLPFEQKYRMADSRTLEIIERRHCGDAKVMSERVTALEIFLQYEGSLAGRQLSHVDGFGTSPTCKSCLARCSQIAHPIHNSIWRANVAFLVLLDKRDWNGTRLTAFATTHCEQVQGVVPKSDELDAYTQQNRCQNICQRYKYGDLRLFCHVLVLML